MISIPTHQFFDDEQISLSEPHGGVKSITISRNYVNYDIARVRGDLPAHQTELPEKYSGWGSGGRYLLKNISVHTTFGGGINVQLVYEDSKARANTALVQPFLTVTTRTWNGIVNTIPVEQDKKINDALEAWRGVYVFNSVLESKSVSVSSWITTTSLDGAPEQYISGNDIRSLILNYLNGGLTGKDAMAFNWWRNTQAGATGENAKLLRSIISKGSAYKTDPQIEYTVNYEASTPPQLFDGLGKIVKLTGDDVSPIPFGNNRSIIYSAFAVSETDGIFTYSKSFNTVTTDSTAIEMYID